VAAEPTHIPAITKALLELGFQPQIPAAFPAARPMLWGGFRHGATQYGVHVHVAPACNPEVAALARLGLAGHRPRRLYQDNLDLDNSDLMAS
jgi:hypothetical protein